MTQVHGLDVLSVYDIATGDVVQLNALGDDTELVVRGLLDGDGVKSPEGTPYYGGDLSRVAVTFLGADEYEILRAWQKAGRMLRLAGAGPAGALLWNEDTLISVAPETVKGASGGARGYRLTAERRGHGSHNIWLDEDLLAHLGPFVQELGNLGGAWEALSCAQTEGSPGDGSINVEDVGATVGATLRLANRIVFPVSGVRLTGSVSQSGTDATIGTRPQLEFNAVAFAGGAPLVGAYAGLDTAEHDDRVSVAAVTPAGTWSLTLNPLATSAPFTNEIVLYRPALRVGTSTEPGRLAV
jgi:hypothetical protein